MPLAVQLLSPTLSTYGYSADQAGLVRAPPARTQSRSVSGKRLPEPPPPPRLQFQFVAAGAAWKDDVEVVAMGRAMREKVIPPAMVRALRGLRGFASAASRRSRCRNGSCPWCSR